MFAPHYAEHVAHRLGRAVDLRAERAPASETLVSLDAGDVFELLDLIGDTAWGVAPGAGLVGYLPAAALEPVRA